MKWSFLKTILFKLNFIIFKIIVKLNFQWKNFANYYIKNLLIMYENMRKNSKKNIFINIKHETILCKYNYEYLVIFCKSNF